MTKRLKPLLNFRIIVCMIVVTFLSHSLGVVYVQANEEDNNRSVSDVFNSPSGQAPSESEKNSDEDFLTDAENRESEVEDLLQEQSLFSMFFQLFLALAVIIVMIYGLIRFIGKRSLSYQSHRTLQNIGGVHVGTNRSIQLVRVGERVLVVGVGDSIQLLKEINDESEVKKIIEDYNSQEYEQQFSSVYKWLQTKFTPQTDKDKNSNNHFKSLLERQLTDVKNSQQKAHATILDKEKEQR